MSLTPFRAHWSLQTKVLVPVVGLMILLLAATLWVVNARFTRQFQTNIANQMLIAEGVFKNSEQIRAQNLLMRYRNVPTEPQLRAIMKLGDPKTLRFRLNELLGTLGGDYARFTPASGTNAPIEASRSSDFNHPEFAQARRPSIEKAMEGFDNTDVVACNNKLYELVSMPVRIGEELEGVLTFALETGTATAQEFKRLTHTEVALLAGDQMTACTLLKPGLENELRANISDAGQSARKKDPFKVILGGEHFFVVSGNFNTLHESKVASYSLLSSYEQELNTLFGIQRLILLVSLVGILISVTVLFLVIRKATQPLRELQASAEAVGRGDFSKHVLVQTQDECGELASVFNRMVDNLKASRQELEKAVETLKTTQAQLVQSEKLSAIGEFVAGVTHELNNPLTSVIGFAELLQQTPVDERSRRFLDLIVNGAQRCHKIVQSLLSFARQHKPERKLVNLHELVDSAVSILQYQMRTSNIQIETNFNKALPQVMADPHQIQQVFLNLINNARQAIEGFRPKGSIRITTEAKGAFARVTFQDDGPGISAENLKKIFDPFFTTKEVGKGTGLGLSLSYGLIQEHGGSIQVESKAGEGASFVIELPFASETDRTAAQGSGPEKQAPVLQGRNKRVLIVDDEEGILNLVKETLMASGFQTETARDGEEALRNLSKHQYDLTVCDWKMPGMNGRQLFEHVRKSNPQAASRFIFMTGDVMNESTSGFLREHRKICLEKPFSLDDFKRAVVQITEAG
jgi:two-component system, NtrC family, sensor kinase